MPSPLLYQARVILSYRTSRLLFFFGIDAVPQSSGMQGYQSPGDHEDATQEDAARDSRNLKNCNDHGLYVFEPVFAG